MKNMNNIEFWKMNGSGNDFIIIDNRDGKVPEKDMSRPCQGGMQAKGVCRR